MVFAIPLRLPEALELRLNVPRSAAGEQRALCGKKLIANVMNLKVDVLEVEEGPSMGGAMLAAVGCGAYPGCGNHRKENGSCSGYG